MSAVRRQLMWLWAAVWLRWRLTLVEARRVFGGREVAVGGPEYHLAPAEVPLEGVDYDPAELPAELVARLEATRAELMGRSRRVAGPTSRRAHRRRVAALATAAVLATGAVGAGAAALVTGSTGVPAVDRLLGIYEAELDEPDRSRPGTSGRDLQPRSNRSSASIEIPAGDGSQALVSSSYVARDGRICSALTDVDESVRTSVGALTCISPAALSRYLARDHGIVLVANAADDRVVVRGFVSDRVARLGGAGPNGSLDVRLGETWVPAASGVGPLRPFVALGDVGSRDLDPIVLANPDSYIFEASTEDGKPLRIGP